jgi:pimeloyl-ACP methyl ester carboxylesterase
MLEALARQEVVVTPTFRHLEVFTLRGLLTVLWHGDPEAEAAVVLGGGAMGGLLGPADGLYHWLGDELAAPGSGIGVLRVGWRRPNDLDLCTLDLLAAADLAARAGAERFVTGGHSFGGAIAVRAGVAMGDWARGVVTFATQSAGCEGADELTAPLLAFHGDRDELLPLQASEVVAALSGGPTEVVVCEGSGHLLSEAGDDLRARVPGWVRERVAG